MSYTLDDLDRDVYLGRQDIGTANLPEHYNRMYLEKDILTVFPIIASEIVFTKWEKELLLKLVTAKILDNEICMANGGDDDSASIYFETKHLQQIFQKLESHE